MRTTGVRERNAQPQKHRADRSPTLPSRIGACGFQPGQPHADVRRASAAGSIKPRADASTQAQEKETLDEYEPQRLPAKQQETFG